MGRGRRVNKGGPQTLARRRGTDIADIADITAVANFEELLPVEQFAVALTPAWNEAGGPEATADEIASVADELTQATANEHYRLTALRILADPTYENPYIEFAPRRALEAVLAAWQGIDSGDYKLANSHRSWRALWDEARAVGEDELDTYGANPLTSVATKLEVKCRSGRNELPELANAPTLTAPLELEALVAKTGAGARSGKPEDYTRAELRKLLGFLERDCGHLSDDDLRGMALDGHLLPRWQGSPSHLELALYRAERYSWRTQPRAFQKAMRTPYSKLIQNCPSELGYIDDGSRSTLQLRRELMRTHPFVGGFLTAARALDVFAKHNGVATRKDESERNVAVEGASTQLQTALELSYGDAFADFVSQFGGARKLGNVRTGLKKTNGRIVRGCAAFYDPTTGDVHINSAAVKRLLGKHADVDNPSVIEDVVSSVAHELFHAMEARDDGSDRTGMRNSATPEHALDEGATEALARLHTQDLAERMGLWFRERGSLREHATSGSYSNEVKTTLALAAACCGELDKEKLRDGSGYNEPEDLSVSARAWLQDLHLRFGPQARIERMTEILATRLSASATTPAPARAQLTDADVRQLLRECKHQKYQWRRKHQRLLDASGQVRISPSGREQWGYANVAPEDLSAGLAARLEELGL
jgi:hypothetical protein